MLYITLSSTQTHIYSVIKNTTKQIQIIGVLLFYRFYINNRIISYYSPKIVLFINSVGTLSLQYYNYIEISKKQKPTFASSCCAVCANVGICLDRKDFTPLPFVTSNG